MREIARVQQGFFPTQDRIVQAVARLFSFPPDVKGHIIVLDAGCGTGKAIYDLRDTWLKKYCRLSVRLFGIESDKARAQQANELLSTVGGSALWAAIEDTSVSGPVSLLWFNPPYDRIRGVGRTELSLFNEVKEWPGKGYGLLSLIVPDYVLADAESGLAVAIERDYELLGRWRYPEPEYSEFKQCVLIARRRTKSLSKSILSFPQWAGRQADWPVLYDHPRPVAEIRPAPGIVTLRRTRLATNVIFDAVSRSPLRGSLLREASASAPKIGRPLLPLKAGHLALALAGGLCDGIIQAGRERFLVKGTLTSAVRKTAVKEKYDADGEKIADIDVYRTRYELNVRCLRNDGTIENYSSAEPEAGLSPDNENDINNEEVS